MPQNDSFFIGWSNKTPSGYLKKTRLFVLSIIPIILLAAFAFIKSQKPVNNAAFEFGTLTTVEGTLIKKPVPMLRMNVGNDLSGAPVFQHLLLVDVMKFGAEKAISEMEKIAGHSLYGRAVKLNGTLIYYNGKTVLELTEGGSAFIGLSGQKAYADLAKEDKGTAKLRGEIVDTKCFFGVMKPGNGKTHKSCAVRCLSGGIPAILATENKSGQQDYYIILGEDGQSINMDLLDFTADHIQLTGKVERMEDWNILYTSAGKICPLGPKWLFKDMPLCAQ